MQPIAQLFSVEHPERLIIDLQTQQVVPITVQENPSQELTQEQKPLDFPIKMQLFSEHGKFFQSINQNELFSTDPQNSCKFVSDQVFYKGTYSFELNSFNCFSQIQFGLQPL